MTEKQHTLLIEEYKDAKWTALKFSLDPRTDDLKSYFRERMHYWDGKATGMEMALTILKIPIPKVTVNAKSNAKHQKRCKASPESDCWVCPAKPERRMMSSMPECQRCGNYVHHGPVICGDCMESDRGLRKRLEQFVAYHRGNDEEMGVHITDLVDDAERFLNAAN